MSDLALVVDAFHFIRPVILLLLLPVLGLWWYVRRRYWHGEVPEAGIAPHLRAALTVGRAGRRRLLPIDGVALVLALAAVGAAGPTWSRVVDPFLAQSAPLVIAIKVTPSMEADDVAPSRLVRGTQKVRDLLDLRAGARTALIAYAGSAHTVVPMTEDPAVMLPYLGGLDPEVMPVGGDRAGEALALAANLLGEDAGGVLLVADGVDPADLAALDAASSLMVLEMLPEGVDDRGIDALSAPVVRVTPDGSDVARIDRTLNAAYRQAMLENSDQPWQDRGRWLAIPAALLALIWFRRGWTMRWAALAGFLVLASPPAEAGVADWFLTPDQQGRLAFENRQYRRAAELFADPMWRGYALYRDGQYEAAREVLARVDSAEADFIAGMAAIKSQSYRDGVRSFEAVLARDPDFPGAAQNLAVAKEIVVYIERLQETSDTGEDRGIGADEVVFDNESGRGADTEIEAPQEDAAALLSTDAWMNTVDTRTGDFLRQRFAVEAASGRESAQ